MQKRPRTGGLPPIVPSYFPQTDVETLMAENAQLRQRNEALRHTCHELNKTMRFLIKTLNQPLTPRQETRSGRHSR